MKTCSLPEHDLVQVQTLLQKNSLAHPENFHFARWTPMLCLSLAFISPSTSIRLYGSNQNRIKHPDTSRDSPWKRDVFFYQDDLLWHPSVSITAQTIIGICSTYDFIAFYNTALTKRCRHLQVILRPHPSTNGRNIQQRLFLRRQVNPRRLSGLSILECCVKQRINSNLDVVVLVEKSSIQEKGFE